MANAARVKRARHREGRFHSHTQDLLDGLHIALAPVLGRQDRRSRRQPEEEEGHDILHLAGQGCARQRRLSHGPSMMTSAAVTPTLIRFWRAIGTTSAITVR